MKKTFILILLFIAGCGSKGDKVVPNALRNVNNKGIASAEYKLCKTSEKLEEIEVQDNETVYYDFSGYQLFGFVNGNSTCALTKEYKKIALAEEEFTVVPPNDCVVNGSLWELSSSTRQNNTTVLTLKEFESNNTAQIKISSGYTVKLKELGSLVGIHFLKCMPKKD